MTPAETAGLLAYFASAWPNATVTDEQAEIWGEHLGGVDADDGRAAARALVAGSQWFPSIAEFREACLVAARRRLGDVPALSEPRPSVEVRREQAKKWIAVAREAMGTKQEDLG